MLPPLARADRWPLTAVATRDWNYVDRVGELVSSESHSVANSRLRRVERIFDRKSQGRGEDGKLPYGKALVATGPAVGFAGGRRVMASAHGVMEAACATCFWARAGLL